MEVSCSNQLYPIYPLFYLPLFSSPSMFPAGNAFLQILARVLLRLFPGSEILKLQNTELCFFCHFSLPYDASVLSLPTIEQAMSHWQEDLQIQEMLPKNAADALRDKGMIKLASLIPSSSILPMAFLDGLALPTELPCLSSIDSLPRFSLESLDFLYKEEQKSFFCITGLAWKDPKKGKAHKKQLISAKKNTAQVSKIRSSFFSEKRNALQWKQAALALSHDLRSYWQKIPKFSSSIAIDTPFPAFPSHRQLFLNLNKDKDIQTPLALSSWNRSSFLLEGKGPLLSSHSQDSRSLYFPKGSLNKCTEEMSEILDIFCTFFSDFSLPYHIILVEKPSSSSLSSRLWAQGLNCFEELLHTKKLPFSRQKITPEHLLDNFAPHLRFSVPDLFLKSWPLSALWLFPFSSVHSSLFFSLERLMSLLIEHKSPKIPLL